jgi:hypothetical protein
MTIAATELVMDMGDRVDLRFTFAVTDANGNDVLTTPTTFTVKVRRPDTVEYNDTANSTLVGTGLYEWHTTLNMVDLWYVRAIGTGAMEVAIRVRRSAFTNP